MRDDFVAYRNIVCGCGHLVADHSKEGPCRQIWGYPDVLTTRRCACMGAWRPAKTDSRYDRWQALEFEALRRMGA